MCCLSIVPLYTLCTEDGLYLYCSERETHHYPAESTMGAPPFIIPDFSISTHTATIAHITTNGSTTDVRHTHSVWYVREPVVLVLLSSSGVVSRIRRSGACLGFPPLRASAAGGKLLLQTETLGLHKQVRHREEPCSQPLSFSKAERLGTRLF